MVAVVGRLIFLFLWFYLQARGSRSLIPITFAVKTFNLLRVLNKACWADHAFQSWEKERVAQSLMVIFVSFSQNNIWHFRFAYERTGEKIDGAYFILCFAVNCLQGRGKGASVFVSFRTTNWLLYDTQLYYGVWVYGQSWRACRDGNRWSCLFKLKT